MTIKIISYDVIMIKKSLNKLNNPVMIMTGYKPETKWPEKTYFDKKYERIK